MKTRMCQPVENRVTIEKDGVDRWTGRTIRLETEYFFPPDGGYVREHDGQQFPQVSDGLSNMVRTFSAKPKSLLGANIVAASEPPSRLQEPG